MNYGTEGKRGSGKSYTMGVIAEGLASLEEETANSITSLIIDTMGIYWTMKERINFYTPV